MSELTERLAQQAAVSELAVYAQEATSDASVLAEATRRVADALDAPVVLVVEESDDQVVLRAACGIDHRVVDRLLGASSEFAALLPTDDEPHICADASPLPDRLGALGMRSTLACRLPYSHRRWSTIVLSPERDRFDRRDATFLNAVAHIIGTSRRQARTDQALGRADQTIDDLSSALVETLLPPQLPDIPGIAIAARRPEAPLISGDFYDAFPTTRQHWALVAGRSQPRGPAAIKTATRALHTIRGVAAVDPRPTEVLRIVDEALRERPGGTCTITYALLRRQRSGFLVNVATAGTSQPLRIRADRTIEQIGASSHPLAADPRPSPSRELIGLDPNESLVLPTVAIDWHPQDDSTDPAAILQHIKPKRAEDHPQFAALAITYTPDPPKWPAHGRTARPA